MTLCPVPFGLLKSTLLIEYVSEYSVGGGSELCELISAILLSYTPNLVLGLATLQLDAFLGSAPNTRE